MHKDFKFYVRKTDSIVKSLCDKNKAFVKFVRRVCCKLYILVIKIISNLTT